MRNLKFNCWPKKTDKADWYNDLIAVEAPTLAAAKALCPNRDIVHDGDDARNILLLRAGVPLTYPADKNKARFLSRIATRGVDPLRAVGKISHTLRPSTSAVNHVINKHQGHEWYAWAKSGDNCDGRGPQTLRGRIRKIKRIKSYLYPGYPGDPRPHERFLSVE
jgi:hypothetical protein